MARNYACFIYHWLCQAGLIGRMVPFRVESLLHRGLGKFPGYLGYWKEYRFQRWQENVCFPFCPLWMNSLFPPMRRRKHQMLLRGPDPDAMKGSSWDHSGSSNAGINSGWLWNVIWRFPSRACFQNISPLAPNAHHQGPQGSHQL